ncbi:MAG TPA: DUF4215 domain-containing protein [Polyangiaceae bacterium]|jgi:cysteine-rich repeat protein|nr:DUF4215 domain-containing protein [Polyangiaceae bacterium]
MRTSPVWLTLAGGCLAVAGLDGEYTLDPSGAGGGKPPDTASSVSTSGGMPGVGGSTGGDSSMGGTGGSRVCGNTMIEPPEECDDGNTDPLDGCSALCEKENPDACDSAPVITLNTGDVVVVSGDTTGAADDFTAFMGAGDCDAGPWYGPDHVFTVIPNVSGTLLLLLSPAFDDGLLHVRDTCADTVELACDYASNPRPFTLSVFVDAGQPYFVIVDSWSNEEGAFTLTLELD